MSEHETDHRAGVSDVHRPRVALLASCRHCRRLHRPERPLAFNPVCEACTSNPR